MCSFWIYLQVITKHFRNCRNKNLEYLCLIKLSFTSHNMHRMLINYMLMSQVLKLQQLDKEKQLSVISNVSVELKLHFKIFLQKRYWSQFPLLLITSAH
jgi:hypothetical protein